MFVLKIIFKYIIVQSFFDNNTVISMSSTYLGTYGDDYDFVDKITGFHI